MPIETIKCQECGSVDVTEFKPGSYVCRHCEAVFKHLDPSKLTLTNELCACGTFAIGHCAECAAPVCGTHSALWHHQRRLCSSDWNKREAARLHSLEQASKKAEKAQAEGEDRARQELASLQSRADELVRLLAARRAAGSERIRTAYPLPKKKYRAWRVYQWERNYDLDEHPYLRPDDRQTFYFDGDLRLFSMNGDKWVSPANRGDPLEAKRDTSWWRSLQANSQEVGNSP
jgi:chemotaxis protein histidine kinase CheA